MSAGYVAFRVPASRSTVTGHSGPRQAPKLLHWMGVGFAARLHAPSGTSVYASRCMRASVARPKKPITTTTTTTTTTATGKEDDGISPKHTRCANICAAHRENTTPRGFF